MRFFHPKANPPGRFVRGASRRRERLRPHRLEPAPLAREVIAVTSMRLGGARYEPGQTLRAGGEILADLLERDAVWIPTSADWWRPDGRVLMVEPGVPAPIAIAPTEGALRIAMGCSYDPGNSVYRYHTAINEHTRHACAYLNFQRHRQSNPFHCPQHVKVWRDINTARAYVYEADVLHHHVDYFLGDTGLGPKPRRDQLVIRHYHGSVPGGPEKQHPILNRAKDDALGAVLLGARLTLCALRPDRMHWLPIPVPVERYARLRQTERGKQQPFRIAHSPTRADYKGTQVFLDVCERLTQRGVSVEPVLIGMTRTRRRNLEPDRKSHAEALRIKARCDAVFDSFWLGLQGSGLEGAAMGLPVIAGDPEVAALYRASIGYVPYTFANDAASLERAIERIATDALERSAEAARVHRYVLAYHDYPQVAARYESILSGAALGANHSRASIP